MWFNFLHKKIFTCLTNKKSVGNNNNKDSNNNYANNYNIKQNLSSFLANFFIDNRDLISGMISIAIYGVIYMVIFKNKIADSWLKLFFPINIKITPYEMPLIYFGWVSTSLLIFGIDRSFFYGLSKKARGIIQNIFLALLYYQLIIWIVRFIINPPFTIWILLVAVILYWTTWLYIIETFYVD
jgi:hypothetical protein